MAHVPVSDPADRRLYLLSLWRDAADAPWRAVLRPTGDGARIVFPDVEALALFLLRMADSGELPEAGDAPNATDTCALRAHPPS